MRRRALSLVACTAALFLVPALVSAAGVQKGEFEVSPTIGFVTPLGGDLGELADPGFVIGAQGLYYLSSRAGLGAAIVYNGFGSAGDGYDFSVTEIHAIGKMFFSEGSSIDFYGKGAVGFFINSFSSDQFLGFGASSTDFGVGAGAGIQKRQSDSWGWFAEGMFMLDDFSELYLTLRVGANFYFGPVE